MEGDEEGGRRREKEERREGGGVAFNLNGLTQVITRQAIWAQRPSHGNRKRGEERGEKNKQAAMC